MLLLQGLSGIDPSDETTIQEKIPDYTTIIERSTVQNTKVGIPRNHFLDYLSPEVERLFYNFVDVLKSIGMRVYDLELHSADNFFEPSLSIARAEAAEIHLEWLRTRAEDYGEGTRKRFEHGLQVRAVDYLRYKKL